MTCCGGLLLHIFTLLNYDWISITNNYIKWKNPWYFGKTSVVNLIVCAKPRREHIKNCTNLQWNITQYLISMYYITHEHISHTKSSSKLPLLFWFLLPLSSVFILISILSVITCLHCTTANLRNFSSKITLIDYIVKGYVSEETLKFKMKDAWKL